MTFTDVLYRATDGRIISLSEQTLTVEDMLTIHNNPFTVCETCGGNCVVGMALGINTETGDMAMMPLVCPTCEGEGQMVYISNS